MKDFRLPISCGICLILALCACQKNEMSRTVTWTPVFLKVGLQDEQGNDLMNPDGDAFVGNNLIISFQGKKYTYEPDKERNEDELSVDFKYYSSKKYCLTFGPIDGALDCEEDIVIRIEHFKDVIIHYSCSEHDNILLECNRKWYYKDKSVNIPLWLKCVSN